MDIAPSILNATETAKILADPTRLKILTTLFEADDDMCVNEIAAKVNSSQSATSHQLAKLEAYEIVLCFRDGQKMCYELTDAPIVEQIRDVLKTLSVL